MLSHREAKKELLGYFQDNWTDGLVNGLPNSNPPLLPIVFENNGDAYTPKVKYRNVELRGKVSPGEHYAVITLHNLRTTQSSLPGGRISGGGTKFTTPGIGIVQLIFSKSNWSSEEEDYLTAIAHEMFMGKCSENIWFRNATVKEMPEDENRFRTDVDFQYEFDTHLRVPA